MKLCAVFLCSVLTCAASLPVGELQGESLPLVSNLLLNRQVRAPSENKYYPSYPSWDKKPVKEHNKYYEIVPSWDQKAKETNNKYFAGVQYWDKPKPTPSDDKYYAVQPYWNKS